MTVWAAVAARDLAIDFARRAGSLEAGRGSGEPGTPGPSAHAAAEGARRSVRFAIAHLTEREATPYSTQVRALRELGVEAKTPASFLAAREKVLDARTVLVIDEAGSVPTRQMEQALRLADERGARVVLLGDTRQTKAIEAGRPFDQLQAAVMATAVMGEIQRQKDPGLRHAVALAARGGPRRRSRTSGRSARSATTTKT